MNAVEIQRLVDENKPWLPTYYDASHRAAIAAMVVGTASAEQQRIGMKWIIEEACKTFDSTFYPNERDSTFANGKRHVGLEIIKLYKLLPKATTNNNEPSEHG